MSRNKLVFDIETWIDWPFVRDPAFMDAILASYEAPATVKDPIKIAAHHTEWWFKLRKAWTFSPLTAKVCSIAYGDMDSEDIFSITSDDEVSLIRTFTESVEEFPSILTGYNVRFFDVPFLTARASILGLELPRWWPHAKDYQRIADIFDVTGKGKLDDWLRRCDLPVKTGDGAKVEYMQLHEIEAYNRNDVHVERLLARRFAPNMPALRSKNIPEYEDLPI